MTPQELISDLDAVLARRGETIIVRRISTGSPKVNQDVTMKAHVRTVDSDDIVGTTAQNDSVVIMSMTKILETGWPGGSATGPSGPFEVDERVPAIGDKVVIQGRVRDVKLVKPFIDGDVLVRLELTVKG